MWYAKMGLLETLITNAKQYQTKQTVYWYSIMILWADMTVCSAGMIKYSSIIVVRVRLYRIVSSGTTISSLLKNFVVLVRRLTIFLKIRRVVYKDNMLLVEYMKLKKSV